MYKRAITYTDFDDNEVTETFYFHISKSDLIGLEVESEEGLEGVLTKLIKEKDRKKLLELFQRLVLMSYGEKSEDGKRFVKTPELTENFKHTAAYEAFFMELATDDKKAAEFVINVVPKDLSPLVEEQIKTPEPETPTATN